MLTEIVYEDQEVLVVRKPAGLAAQTARVGQQDVVSELKNYLRHSPGAFSGSKADGGGKSGSSEPGGGGKSGSSKFAGGGKNSSSKPGSGGGSCGSKYVGGGKAEPYLGVVHRLDQPVEGLLVFAKNRDAARSLTEQLQGQGEDGAFSKHYYAVLCGIPARKAGRLTDILSKESVVVGTRKEYRSVVHKLPQGADILCAAVLPADAETVRISTAETEIDAILSVDAETARISAAAAKAATVLPADAETIRTSTAETEAAAVLPASAASADALSVPAVSGGNHSPGHRAELEYEILQVREEENLSLADIRLITGRFHQIRAQMAHAGTPLLGDMKYGSEASMALARSLGIRHVALCAYSLEFRHPVSGKRMEFQNKPGNPAFSFFSQL